MDGLAKGGPSCHKCSLKKNIVYLTILPITQVMCHWIVRKCVLVELERFVKVRPGAHYPHVTWAHVMLRVRLGCERRFNLEFYGADSHFSHSAYVTWSHVELWSAHVPALLSRGRLAREPIRAPREITWRKQSDRSVNLRYRIQC